MTVNTKAEHAADTVQMEIKHAPAVNVPALTDRDTRGTDTPPAKAARVTKPAPVQIGKITGAIAAVMGEMGVVEKGGYNKFHGYKYAKMEDVLQMLTPLIAKHGLVIWQTEVLRSFVDDDKAVSIQYEFKVSHSSGETWPDALLQTGLSRCRDSKGGFDDKAFNKAHTQARKYFLLSLFQIPTGDIDEADSQQTGNAAPPPRPEPKRPPALTKAEQEVASRLPDHDPVTGETGPREIRPEVDQDGLVDWLAWGRKYMLAIEDCETIDQANQWHFHNAKHAADFKEAMPVQYVRMDKWLTGQNERLRAESEKSPASG